LHHIDLYRLDAGGQQGLGLEEILDDAKGVTVIEWAERLAAVPAHATYVEMLYLTDSERSISISK
jgi:tRNA A37 threonylcarbamoyladenosine biosynthesis protein TsaE